jgi:hypothetical protein
VSGAAFGTMNRAGFSEALGSPGFRGVEMAPLVLLESYPETRVGRLNDRSRKHDATPTTSDLARSTLVQDRAIFGSRPASLESGVCGAIAGRRDHGPSQDGLRPAVRPLPTDSNQSPHQRFKVHEASARNPLFSGDSSRRRPHRLGVKRGSNDLEQATNALEAPKTLGHMWS